MIDQPMHKSDTKEDLPCPHCRGTGKYTSPVQPRCTKCRGSGRLAIDSYCDCQLGRDLQAVDQRRNEDRVAKYDPEYST